MEREQSVLVVGCGISGTAAANLLIEQGKHVLLYDSNSQQDIGKIKEKLPADFDGELAVGQMPRDWEDKITQVVISPGVPIDSPLVLHFQEKKIPVIGEVELAFQVAKGTLAAITGTNGKTTTTALVGAILREQYASVFVVGNIGDPYTCEAGKMREDSFTVAEISSFQLESIDTFHPQVSAILNITPDHLNRHHTLENYIAMKESITKNQGKEDLCVLNYEDPVLRKFGETLPCRVCWFSSRQPLREGLYLDKDEMILSCEDLKIKLLNVHDMNLLGVHNYENVMAAIGISLGLGVEMNAILRAVRNFQAVEHRIEYVTEKNGVKYYNDSKGTNPDAAIQGISAMERPTFLIGGGYDKGASYDAWIESFHGKVKKLVLLGATADAIAACAKAHGFTAMEKVETLRQAVELCAREAEPGDCVLLSPACASWDMFPNYEERGRLFKEYVRALPEEGTISPEKGAASE